MAQKESHGTRKSHMAQERVTWHKKESHCTRKSHMAQERVTWQKKESYGTRKRQSLTAVDCVWNVMAHAQKPDFVFRRNERVRLNRWGASVQSTTGSRGVRISGSNAGYSMFRGSVKSTGYPFPSPGSPSLPRTWVTACHHISTGLYCWTHRVPR
jgi:hypothetical protein